jgi:hypothetical protein
MSHITTCLFDYGEHFKANNTVWALTKRREHFRQRLIFAYHITTRGCYVKITET